MQNQIDERVLIRIHHGLWELARDFDGKSINDFNIYGLKKLTKKMIEQELGECKKSYLRVFDDIGTIMPEEIIIEEYKSQVYSAIVEDLIKKAPPRGLFV